MTDRPIIFSAPMVRAMLDGRKTQTRRVLTCRNTAVFGENWSRKKAWDWLRLAEAVPHCGGAAISAPWCHAEDEPTSSEDCGFYRIMPVFQTGDRLWVREGFIRYHELDGDDTPCSELLTCFRADGWPLSGWYDREREETRDAPPWKPSIHMPRWASRLTLAVTDVRVQRLQEISDMYARAEGVGSSSPFPGHEHDFDAPPTMGAVENFEALWNSLHGPEAWSANPWVVALTFTVEQRNIDALPAVSTEPNDA